MRLAHELTVTSLAAKPDQFDTFSCHLDQSWIEEALVASGTATFRRRRLPAEQVIWMVIGMALMRNRPIQEVVEHLALALPTPDGRRVARIERSSCSRGTSVAPRVRTKCTSMRPSSTVSRAKPPRHSWPDMPKSR